MNEILDALGNPIVFGKTYGYSTNSSGISKTTIGSAVKFTKTGKVTLNIVQVKKFLYDEAIDSTSCIVTPAEQVSMRGFMLFPVELK